MNFVLGNNTDISRMCPSIVPLRSVLERDVQEKKFQICRYVSILAQKSLRILICFK